MGLLTIGLGHYLVLATLLLCVGIAVMAVKRNAIGILIGTELVLNAANINFVAFGHYRVGGTDGILAAAFIIVLAAAEAAIALAIFLNFYHQFATVDVDRGATLKG